MKLKHISVPALAFLLISQVSFGQNTLSLKKGNKYQVVTKTETSTVMDMQGQPMEVGVNANATYEVAVKDNQNNNYQLSNKITGISMTMSQMGQEMSFDSNKEDDMNGPMGSAFKGLINSEKQVVIDQTGKIVSTDKIDNDMLAAAGQEFEASGWGATAVFMALPKDLSVGKTWTKKQDEDGSTTNTTYKVKAVNGNLVTLDVSGDMDINKTIENMGMEITNKSKGTFTGEIVVNKTTNIIKNSTTTVKADGISSVMGQEIPTSSTVKTTADVKSL